MWAPMVIPFMISCPGDKVQNVWKGVNIMLKDKEEKVALLET